MTIQICKQCGKEFVAYNSNLNRSKSKYCSLECYNKSRATPIRICAFCGKEFKRWSSGKFCSHKCYSNSRKKRVPCTCVICGKNFDVVESGVKRGYGKCCSKECAIIHHNTRKKCVCVNCGKEYYRNKAYAYSSKFCSRDCRNKYMVGPNAPSWMGGKAFEPYCYKFNKSLKERVRAFFGYKCVECGAPQNGKGLHVHHVHYHKGSCCDKDAPRTLVPLCVSCHMATNHNRAFWSKHFQELIDTKYGGKCYFTKEEYDKFISSSPDSASQETPQGAPEQQILPQTETALITP